MFHILRQITYPRNANVRQHAWQLVEDHLTLSATHREIKLGLINTEMCTRPLIINMPTHYKLQNSFLTNLFGISESEHVFTRVASLTWTLRLSTQWLQWLFRQSVQYATTVLIVYLWSCSRLTLITLYHWYILNSTLVHHHANQWDHPKANGWSKRMWRLFSNHTQHFLTSSLKLLFSKRPLLALRLARWQQIFKTLILAMINPGRSLIWTILLPHLHPWWHFHLTRQIALLNTPAKMKIQSDRRWVNFGPVKWSDKVNAA